MFEGNAHSGQSVGVPLLWGVPRHKREQCPAGEYSKTIKEVAQGTMGGPFSHEDLVLRHGRFYNVIPSFCLAQGVNDKGEPKFRRIDDHAAGHTNLAATRVQKIEMAMVDYFVVTTRALHDRFGSDLSVGTEDMQLAYRPAPLPDRPAVVG